jgi:hypothetical protein
MMQGMTLTHKTAHEVQHIHKSQRHNGTERLRLQPRTRHCIADLIQERTGRECEEPQDLYCVDARLDCFRSQLSINRLHSHRDNDRHLQQPNQQRALKIVGGEQCLQVEAWWACCATLFGG